MTGTNNFSGSDIKGGEKRCDAMAQVIVCLPLGNARSHRKDRLGPIQSLDLRLFIDA